MAVPPGLSSLGGLHSAARRQSELGGSVTSTAPDLLAVITVSPLPWNVANEKLLGTTSHTWQLTKVIVCPVFLSVFLLEMGTGLCFC